MSKELGGKIECGIVALNNFHSFSLKMNMAAIVLSDLRENSNSVFIQFRAPTRRPGCLCCSTRAQRPQSCTTAVQTCRFMTHK